tara:strand:- start:305 stop:469 length:165 start_codon:yes stop_codon:yes gene_type:complete
MGINKETFIRDREQLLDSQESYEAKLWFVCYQEEKEKNQTLEIKIAELKKKIKN